jgi:CheY-like chemotaxis protein
MSHAKVLVASQNVDDAQQIGRQLAADFANVRLSTDSDCFLRDFEHHRPDVLVLAFDRLDEAQRYYLGLYRLGGEFQLNPHRTVILCSKDEVQAVFALCKQAYFDDYVLYWPHSHDGQRLAMSVWNACRTMEASRPDVPQPAELYAHARQVGELDRVMGREFNAAEQLANAGGSGAAVGAWARHLKGAIAPALAGTRVLVDKIARIRPIVMVVEDDEFARTLVDRALDPAAWETVFAADSATALLQLRRQRPDVILMDIHLPGLDGVALTQRLKAAPDLAAIPIVMMTGDASKSVLLNSMEAGAAAFVVKPFTRESLTQKLQAVLCAQAAPRAVLLTAGPAPNG